MRFVTISRDDHMPEFIFETLIALNSVSQKNEIILSIFQCFILIWTSRTLKKTPFIKDNFIIYILIKFYCWVNWEH